MTRRQGLSGLRGETEKLMALPKLGLDMYFPHGKTPADTDEQVAIDVQIQQLKRKRNTFSSISKLPLEVQITILALVVEEADLDHMRSRPSLLHKITRVSHSWRELVLGCPMLWTHICLNRIEWATMSIQRSKMLPVVIHWFDGFLAHEIGERDPFPRLSDGQLQIRGLRLRFKEGESQLNGLRASNRVLCLLEKHTSLLDFDVAPNPPPLLGSQDIILFTFLNLALNLPKLNCFRFMRSSMGSTRVHFGFSILAESAGKNLTTLEFTDTTDLDVDEVIDLLCRTTQLQCFTLTRPNLWRSMQVTRPTRNSIARLDNLSYIRIHTVHDECIALLSHISYHISAHCDFEAFCIDIESREELTQIAQRLISVSRFETRSHSIHRLHLGNRSGCSVGISCGVVLPGNAYSGGKEPFDHGAPFLLSFSFHDDSITQPMANILMLSLERLDSAQQLSLDASAIELWSGQAIFSVTPQASDVRLDVDNIQRVCSILSEETNNSQLRYVPHLSTLRIRFKQPRCKTQKLVSEALDSLLAMLILRRDLGAKIEELYLIECCEENDLRLFHIRETNVVNRLHWCGGPLDGSVSGSENSNSEDSDSDGSGSGEADSEDSDSEGESA